MCIEFAILVAFFTAIFVALGDMNEIELISRL